VTSQIEMDCHTLVELVTDYLEGALPETDRERLEAHLAACDGCTRYLEQIRTTIRLTGRIREQDLDPEARERLLEVYRAWRADPETR
jgi:anti-sigma factor RsiW